MSPRLIRGLSRGDPVPTPVHAKISLTAEALLLPVVVNMAPTIIQRASPDLRLILAVPRVFRIFN